MHLFSMIQEQLKKTKKKIKEIKYLMNSQSLCLIKSILLTLVPNLLLSKPPLHSENKKTVIPPAPKKLEQIKKLLRLIKILFVIIVKQFLQPMNVFISATAIISITQNVY